MRHEDVSKKIMLAGLNRTLDEWLCDSFVESCECSCHIYHPESRSLCKRDPFLKNLNLGSNQFSIDVATGARSPSVPHRKSRSWSTWQRVQVHHPFTFRFTTVSNGCKLTTHSLSNSPTFQIAATIIYNRLDSRSSRLTTQVDSSGGKGGSSVFVPKWAAAAPPPHPLCVCAHVYVYAC